MTFPDSPASLLQSLIQIPSVNPDGASGQGATGEKACAEWVGMFLEACGADVVFEEVLPGRPNVTGHFHGRKGKPGLLFAPHTDTVSVKGMTIDLSEAKFVTEKSGDVVLPIPRAPWPACSGPSTS